MVVLLTFGWDLGSETSRGHRGQFFGLFWWVLLRWSYSIKITNFTKFRLYFLLEQNLMQIPNLCLPFSYLVYLLRYGHFNTHRCDKKRKSAILSSVFIILLRHFSRLSIYFPISTVYFCQLELITRPEIL